jgi:TPR repeat protein
VLKNPALEWHWLNIAAANGSRAAQLALARCYAEGDGVGRDDARALFFLELAQQHDHVEKRHGGNVVPFRKPGDISAPGAPSK